jgi:hypothetical protein
MKNIQSFEQFLGESSVNEGYDFDKIANEYVENPYGIGASSVELAGEKLGQRMLHFRCENSYDRDKVMQNLKGMGVPANKMTKSTQDKGYKYKYEVNIFEGEAIDEAGKSFGAKWPLTDKIDSNTFYNMWASLDVASTNLSEYMDEANKGKDADALFSLKVAYDELTDLLKSKTIEKQLKAIEAELKEKNALR